MRALSIIQILLFFAVSFYLVYKGIILTEYLVFGVIFGLLIHWSLTNKGNKNIVNIKPLSASFRVLLYDVYLVTLLIRGFLEGFSQDLTFLCVILVGLIILDYFVEG
ncbi:hypothetical protein [Methanocaldococcus fervens]|uniref:Uncharacterized protein n=1 Tax=Methanocaldococcus fervens (strain DSM 4213 / JCM 15782 / AG86) TaxID=573064 RepID=C7P9P3_METFA|nr:hypothetical protein [Methanocaldococcus fervens]ACV25400.1 hypothetical protein Mefer_1597 [Methanocaldococcus fervens AG86]